MRYYYKCPQCGSDEDFVKPREESSGLGGPLLLTGGLFSALLFADYARGRVQCGKCLYIFRPPQPPASPIGNFAAWIVALTAIPVLLAVFAMAFSDSPDLLPSNPLIAPLEERVSAQPRIAAYALLTVPVLIVVPCLVVATIGNARFRRQLAKEYRLTPRSSRDAPLQGPVS